MSVCYCPAVTFPKVTYPSVSDVSDNALQMRRLSNEDADVAHVRRVVKEGKRLVVGG